MTAAIRRSAVVLGALAVVSVASAAFAQAQFVKAMPPAGSKVGSLTEIQLEFNESVDPRFSGLTLTAPHGVNVELGEPEVESGDPRVLVVPISNVLQPGPYTVYWRVVSFDNHSTQGEFSFTVKP
ncbi:MAG: copper resistance protein CopC [Roseiarcus sp.]